MDLPNVPIKITELAENCGTPENDLEGDTLGNISEDSAKEHLMKLSELTERWGKPKDKLIGWSVFGIMKAYCWYDGLVTKSCDVNDIKNNRNIHTHRGWVSLREKSLKLLQDDPDRPLTLTSFCIEPNLFPFHPASKQEESDQLACTEIKIFNFDDLYVNPAAVVYLELQDPGLTGEKPEQPIRVKIDKEEKCQVVGSNMNKPVSPREERCSLNIIGGMVELLKGISIIEITLPLKTQELIIKAMVGNYPGIAGITRETMIKRFSRANEVIEPTDPQILNSAKKHNEKEAVSDIHIIGALLELLKVKDAKKQPFKDDSEIIVAIIEGCGWLREMTTEMLRNRLDEALKLLHAT